MPDGRRRRRVRAVFLAVALALLAMLILLGLVANCRPAWYVPRSIDQSRRQGDTRDLVNLLDEIGGALNRGRGIEFTLSENQVNRWLNSQSEWPSPPPAALRHLRFPQVMMLDDEVRLAATVAWGGMSWVASSDLSVRVVGDAMEIEPGALRVGYLRVPAARLLSGLEQQLARGRFDVSARDGRLRVANRFRWENGERWFRVTRVDATAGAFKVSLEPLAAIR